MLTESQMRLRVTHVVLSLDIGGLERNVINQVRARHRLKQNVSIICLEQRGALADDAERCGAQVFCINKRPGLRFSAVSALREHLGRLRPHVVHTHQFAPLFYSGFASLGMNVPLLVHTQHGKENQEDHRKTQLMAQLGGLFTRVFYCLSNDMADWVLQNSIVQRSKIRVIMNGIDTACYKRNGPSNEVRQALGIPENAPVIGTVGRLTPVKCQSLLIDAFAELLPHVSDAHLLFVGDGPLMDQLQGQAKRLAISHRVHFAGFQTNTVPYQHAMDVFTLPSSSEGMPQSLLEACVAQIPVVASDVGGIPEVIVDGVTGLLCSPGDKAGLSRALLRSLTADRKSALAMAEVASRRVVANYDISRMAREYHQDYLRLLTKRRRSFTPTSLVVAQ